jgi:CheY-like chemotaxis protein
MKPLINIALVDDDEIFVFLTTKIIAATNLVDQITVFKNGLRALNFMKETADKPKLLPEIILLDLSMPVMDGWQFLEEYVKLNPKIEKKIIIYIYTSSISPDDVARAKAISAVSDYIIKPITTEKLINIVKMYNLEPERV